MIKGSPEVTSVEDGIEIDSLVICFGEQEKHPIVIGINNAKFNKTFFLILFDYTHIEEN